MTGKSLGASGRFPNRIMLCCRVRPLHFSQIPPYLFRFTENNLTLLQISGFIAPVSSLNEGRIAIVVLRGMGCGGRGSVVARE
jgi:hypothetical protein